MKLQDLFPWHACMELHSTYEHLLIPSAQSGLNKKWYVANGWQKLPYKLMCVWCAGGCNLWSCDLQGEADPAADTCCSGDQRA
jgi:hypothetical protein